MRTIVSVFLALIFALGLTSTMNAQEPPRQPVTLDIRLTVEGAPCPNATYWVLEGIVHEQFHRQMTDTNGDGVYTYSRSAYIGDQLVIRMVQGAGTISGVFGLLPGEPTTLIKDFGTLHGDLPESIFPEQVPYVKVTGDMLFEASVPGCPTGDVPVDAPAILPDTGVAPGMTVPIAGGLLFLASGVYLRQWIRCSV
jgi:hypothetical protein